MKNIHVLPTDKPTWLHKSILTGILRKSSSCIDDMKQAQGMNIYITSDEEIKFNDYITDGYKVCQWKDNSSLLGRNKVILTTDQDLIKDGVQAIDDEFLEWFVKNPNCEEVGVINEIQSYKSNRSEKWIYEYKIIIPKEEPKFENSIENSINVMSIANSMFGKKEEPKQETLEEELLQQIKFCLICKNDSQAIRLIEKYGFQKQEQMYSEEEVIYLLYSLKNYLGFGEEVKEQEWFKQFKKK